MDAKWDDRNVVLKIGVSRRPRSPTPVGSEHKGVKVLWMQIAFLSHMFLKILQSIVFVIAESFEVAAKICP